MPADTMDAPEPVQPVRLDPIPIDAPHLVASAIRARIHPSIADGQLSAIVHEVLDVLAISAYEVHELRTDTNPAFLAETYNRIDGHYAYKQPDWPVFAAWLAALNGQRPGQSTFPKAETYQGTKPNLSIIGGTE